MITLHNNYSFKYTKSKHVYCILEKKILNTSRGAFYSISKDHTTCIQNTHRLRHLLNNSEITHTKMELQDLKYIANLMKLELAIIICEKNDSYEIYYSTCNST
jgi:hypothetical protein